MLRWSQARKVGWWSILILLAAPLATLAADYPSKPVKIIIQAAAGSGPDMIARIVADGLTRQLGKPFLIINQPGAGGLIAAQAAASAEPDGYTLYMPSGSALMVLPETHARLPFNFETEFLPIGMIGKQPMLITVSPKLGISTLPGLIALAKKRPGEILYAGNTPGTVPSLTGDMLKQRASIDTTFVPYPGAAAALKDLMSGQISIVIESMPALAGAIQGGSVTVLAASEKRIPQFPDVATVAETLPGFVATGWFALLARAGTSDIVVQKIGDGLRSSLADAGLLEKFASLSTETDPMSPAELRSFIQHERELWLPVIRKAGRRRSDAMPT
ncbi:MAG: tripartite tricarboxylate transporter substrate binding protein [Xanthobacteraceae bacterium]|nr:tripartite tricarboxylate transporter substrate binding protein [Xanthobacteraceae bacterium]